MMQSLPGIAKRQAIYLQIVSLEIIQGDCSMSVRQETGEKYMRLAIELAKKAEGFTNPNPMVGAVIVKDGKVVAGGYHHRYGDLHAERDALKNFSEGFIKDATMYVTLEPCCHTGKQPPCTEAIVESGIKHVVIGSRDPNPLVHGKGVAFLRDHGVEVTEDFLRDECDALNPVFFKYISEKIPYVVLKYAMTADGKIATATGESKWITGEDSRSEVQRMRHRYMAIMVGIGTVLADDPMLNVRIEGLKSPVRVICDSHLRVPVESNIVRTAQDIRTIVAFADGDVLKQKALSECGVELMNVPASDGRVDVAALIKKLGESGIDSVFVEGGGTLNDSLRAAGVVDRVECFVAPKIFGGTDAKSPVEGIGIGSIGDALKLSLENVRKIGDDVLLTYVRNKMK